MQKIYFVSTLLQHINSYGIDIQNQMHVTVKKWGNSASVRIPIAVMKAINLHLNDRVDIREEGGCIVIEPIRNEYNLEKLLDGITSKNLHSEFSFEPRVGKEVL